MKWAVIGSNGMLGNDLVEYLSSQGEAVTGFHRGNLDLDGNLSELDGFDVLVNCVAHTKVDSAETEVAESYLANAEIPRKLASYAGISVKLIHISTDYVFDGSKGTAYLPLDEKSPLGVYGKSKSEGEDAVLENSEALVIRTSWLYGAHGPCFPRTIARKLLSGDGVSVVSDQVGSPTHALNLARFIHLAGSNQITERILHGVSSGSCSWFEFAEAIAAKIPGSGAVRAVASSEYPTTAPRPPHSVLEPSKVAGWQIPDWTIDWELASDRILAGCGSGV